MEQPQQPVAVQWLLATRGLVLSVIGLVLIGWLFLAFACGPEASATVREAQAALKERYGAEAYTSHEISGPRGAAVCGMVGGKRFVYRSGDLSVEGDRVSFELLYRSWCADA